MTQKYLFLKNGLIIGKMDKRYGELMHMLWKNLPYNSNIQVDLGDLSFAPTSVKTKQCEEVSSGPEKTQDEPAPSSGEMLN